MGSIKLRKWQIDYLKSKAGSKTLATAIERYCKGDFTVIQNSDITHGKENVLQVYPTRNKEALKLGGSMVRAILTAHINKPINLDNDIAILDKQINDFFRPLENIPYIEIKSE